MGKGANSRSVRPPAVWNNLANVYAHIGPVAKSFPTTRKPCD